MNIQLLRSLIPNSIRASNSVLAAIKVFPIAICWYIIFISTAYNMIVWRRVTRIYTCKIMYQIMVRGKPDTYWTTIVFGHAPISPFSTLQYMFDKSVISIGLEEEDMIGSTLWHGRTEPESKRIKEENILGLNDNIIDGDMIWATEVSLDLIFDCIEEVNTPISTFSTWE